MSKDDLYSKELSKRNKKKLSERSASSPKWFIGGGSLLSVKLVGFYFDQDFALKTLLCAGRCLGKYLIVLIWQIINLFTSNTKFHRRLWGHLMFLNRWYWRFYWNGVVKCSLVSLIKVLIWGQGCWFARMSVYGGRGLPIFP